jgi:hypothetical protein
MEMIDEKINYYYNILNDGIESNNINVNIIDEYFPVADLMVIISKGERNIERLVSFFEKGFHENRQYLDDLKLYYPTTDAYGVVYNLIRNSYLDEFGEEIIIENRDRSIDDILK